MLGKKWGVSWKRTEDLTLLDVIKDRENGNFYKIYLDEYLHFHI